MSIFITAQKKKKKKWTKSEGHEEEWRTSIVVGYVPVLYCGGGGWAVPAYESQHESFANLYK